MKIYNTNVSIQNFGSAFLIILRGSTEDVQQTFNSFYNWAGTNSTLKLDENGANSIGIFWSNAAAISRYWFNRFLMLNPQAPDKLVMGGQFPDANLFVELNLKEMWAVKENFMTFDKTYFEDTHSLGKITAESPDLDFKDAVVTNAFKPKATEKVEELVEEEIN